MDFATKTATITCKDGQSVTREAVEKAFAGSNYGVASFARRSGG